MTSPAYNPSVFHQPSLREAQAVILTAEDHPSTHRWRVETPYLAQLAISLGKPDIGDRTWQVLDYGCGVGRISKLLVEDGGTRVVGVDISQPMLDLAVDYVGKGHAFKTELVSAGLPADAYDTVIAIWTLQHVADPAADIASIHRALRPGGRLFVVNNVNRCIPVLPHENAGSPWFDDGLDVAAMVREKFKTVRFGGLDQTQVGLSLARNAYWGVATK